MLIVEEDDIKEQINEVDHSLGYGRSLDDNDMGQFLMCSWKYMLSLPTYIFFTLVFVTY